MPDPRSSADDFPRTVAIVTSIAYSLANFRGPLISEMVARGIRILALAPDYDEATRAAVVRLGAEPIDIALDRTGMHPLRDLKSLAGLTALFRRLRPDAVFCYFAKPVIYGGLAARFAGIGRCYGLIAGLGYAYTPGSGQQTLRRRLLRSIVSGLYRLALRGHRRVFFQNDDDVAAFVDAGLVDRDKVVRIEGTGVDLDRLAFTAPPEGPIRFLLMARLLREKGIGEYVAAARIVRARHPEVGFDLLGGFDPNPGGFQRDEVIRWNAEGVVNWHDHVDDVRPWLARCSVYVLPSYYREGKPRSTQEALATGRPVITTDAPGCRDTVVDGVNGFIVPARDVDSLVAAMERFIRDPGLIPTMGRASRTLAEERFDVHVINARMLAAMGMATPSGPQTLVNQAVSDRGHAGRPAF